jgi:lysophospholipase L1-like esterase
VKGGAGETITLGGWIKSQGSVKVQAAVHAYAEGYRQNQFLQLQFVQEDTDWMRFQKEITLPEWTAFFDVLLMAEGDGRAWLDDVENVAAGVDPGKPQSPKERMTSAPPAKGKPWQAGWGFYPTFPTAWMSKHEDFLQRTKKGGIEVVFLGDSITQGWGDTGQKIWREIFEKLGAVNYGIGGDSTRQVLWRIQNGEIGGLEPKLFVLKIGTNNLYDDHNGGSDEEIARGIKTIIDTLREKHPAARVLLLGILPRQNEHFMSRAERINAQIKKFDDGASVRFLDISAEFQTEKGKLKADLYDADQLHLAEKGYEKWAESMQPLFTEMLSAARK